jgi:iron complex outermembrane recepter protein
MLRASAGLLMALPSYGVAQQPEGNVVTRASDAFGVSIGVEALGLYSAGQVRGFDPLAAGNARIDGLYFDLQGIPFPYGPLPPPLVEDARIRIGLAGAGYAFPAPTGIVDFSLRTARGAPGLTSTFYVGPYGTIGLDLDGHAPFASDRCGARVGATRRWDELIPDVTQHTSDLAVIIECQPSERSDLRVFWGQTLETHQKIGPGPTVYLSNAELPAPYEAHYTGQSWASSATVLTDYGVTYRTELPHDWIIQAGVFRSVFDQPYSGSDLLNDPSPAGRASDTYIGYPDQRTSSTSGELRLTHAFTHGAQINSVLFTLRARSVTAYYGGYDQVDLGTAILGTVTPAPEPKFTYTARTVDDISQWTAGAAYVLHWQSILDLTLGLQRAWYDRTISEPGVAVIRQSDEPTLYYGSVAAPLSHALTAYASLTRGLEDGGTAPANATNRGQLLPVSRTGQEEVGVRFELDKTTAMIVDVFQVRHPYYNVGSTGAYTWLGTERHTGLELSVDGQIATGFTVVLGALVMAPVIEPASQAVGTIGTEPLAQPHYLLQLSADYHPTFAPSWSLDLVANRQGPESVRLDNGVQNPEQTTVTLGGRYRFSIGRTAATLRVQVTNVTNQTLWLVVDPSGGLYPYPPHHMAQAYLTVSL